jgi:hypothetical protein
MDQALAFAISLLIVAVGAVNFIAGLGSSEPAYWFIAGLLIIGIGLWSAFGSK